MGTSDSPTATDLLYDGRGLLRRSSATAPGSTDFSEADPLYSSEGLLLARRVQSQTTHGGGGDEETPPVTDVADETTYLFYFAGRPIAQLRRSASPPDADRLLYLATDHLGTPVLATDELGQTVWEGGLDPFGTPYAFAEPVPGDEPPCTTDDCAAAASVSTASATVESAGIFLRFPGQWDDASFGSSGLRGGVYYNLHRWYEGQTGRYSQADRFLPLSWKDPNPYVYSRNRPLALTDPKGLFVIDPSCDCAPPWNPPENIPRAIGQAGNFPNRPKCQEILKQYRVWPCVPNRFGPQEIGGGPLIKCQKNAGDGPCGEFTQQFLDVPATVHLYTGAPVCPRYNPRFGIAVTLFHETVHSCGIADEQIVFEITEVCTGWY
jgi:RHS repeat-associated protein